MSAKTEAAVVYDRNDCIDVVTAVVIRGGRLLLTQRPAAKDFPFRWESPGGKVEGKETHAQALRRELLEELGVESTVDAVPLWSGKFLSGGEHLSRLARSVHVHLYLTRIEGDPKPREGQGIGWFVWSSIGTLPLAPANQKCVGLLRELTMLDELRAAGGAW